MPKKNNLLQRFIIKTFFIKPETKVASQMRIDPEVSEQVEEITKENQTLKVQLMEKDNAIKKFKAEQNRREVAGQIAHGMSQQKKKIEEEDLGDLISMRALFQSINSKKFSGMFVVKDRNEETSSKFQDIFIAPKIGCFVVKDVNNNILSIVPDLKRLFVLKGLRDKLQNFVIPLAVDENGKYMPELGDVDMEVSVWNEKTLDYDVSEELRDKARNIIVAKDIQIRRQSDLIKRLELANNDLRTSVINLKRSSDINASRSKEYNAQLIESIATGYKNEVFSSKLIKNITVLTDMNDVLNSELEAFKTTIGHLLERLESKEEKTKFEEERDKLFDFMEMLQDKLKIIQPTGNIPLPRMNATRGQNAGQV